MLSNGCIIGTMCKVTSKEIVPENTIIYGEKCQRRVQGDRPAVSILILLCLLVKYGVYVIYSVFISASNSSTGFSLEDFTKLPPHSQTDSTEIEVKDFDFACCVRKVF